MCVCVCVRMHMGAWVSILYYTTGARGDILTFRLEESAFPVSMAMLDFVIICSINLEQEACNMVPSSSDAGNVEM